MHRKISFLWLTQYGACRRQTSEKREYHGFQYFFVLIDVFRQFPNICGQTALLQGSFLTSIFNFGNVRVTLMGIRRLNFILEWHISFAHIHVVQNVSLYNFTLRFNVKKYGILREIDQDSNSRTSGNTQLIKSFSSSFVVFLSDSL